VCVHRPWCVCCVWVVRGVYVMCVLSNPCSLLGLFRFLGFFNFLLLSCIKPLGKARARKLICKRYISFLWINIRVFYFLNGNCFKDESVNRVCAPLRSSVSLALYTICTWLYVFSFGFLLFFVRLAVSPAAARFSLLFPVACSGFSRSVPRSLSHIFPWHNCKRRKPLSGRI